MDRERDLALDVAIDAVAAARPNGPLAPVVVNTAWWATWM